MADFNFDRSVEMGQENGQDGAHSEFKTPQTNNGQIQRLMITHIVNENFKSYAGKQVLGPFHKVSFIVQASCHS